MDNLPSKSHLIFRRCRTYGYRSRSQLLRQLQIRRWCNRSLCSGRMETYSGQLFKWLWYFPLKINYYKSSTVGTCPSLHTSTTTTVNCTYKGETLATCSDVVEGTRAEFRCAPFYEIQGMNKFPVRICSNGQWSGGLPECVPGNVTWIFNERNF